MKKLLCLPLFLLLSSCSYVKEYHYVDVVDKIISIHDVFYQEEDLYYIYIYSSFCGHCMNLENDVVKYTLHHDGFYLLTYTSELKTGSDYYLSIGATDIYQVVIAGTPTILEINQRTLTDMIVGENNIKRFISN